MADDKLELLLRAWGVAYGEAPKSYYRRRQLSDASHPIADAMQFAPGKRPKRITKALLNRDGRSRRRIMARAAGVKGLDIIPIDYVDAVPCKESNSGGGQPADQAIPPHLQRVEQAARQLFEAFPLRGLCLRANYCLQGSHAAKVEWLTEQLRQMDKYAGEVKLKRFRDELAFARIWMAGNLSALKAP